MRYPGMRFFFLLHFKSNTAATRCSHMWSPQVGLIYRSETRNNVHVRLWRNFKLLFLEPQPLVRLSPAQSKKKITNLQFSEDTSGTFCFWVFVACVQRKQLCTPLYETHLVLKKKKHPTCQSQLILAVFPSSFLVFFFASLCYDLGCSRHSSSASNAASSGELAFSHLFCHLLRRVCKYGNLRFRVWTYYESLQTASLCRDTLQTNTLSRNQRTTEKIHIFCFFFYFFFNEFGRSRRFCLQSTTPRRLLLFKSWIGRFEMNQIFLRSLPRCFLFFCQPEIQSAPPFRHVPKIPAPRCTPKNLSYSLNFYV